MKFLKIPIGSLEPNIIYQTIPHNKKQFKQEAFILFDQSISERDGKKLEFALLVAFCDGVDDDYKSYYHKLLLETWHEQHEDIVTVIWFNFKDDMFSDALYQIATQPSVYRKFDFDLEPALRKCVLALKEINTQKSNEHLEKLLASQNPNVMYALEVYQK